MGGKNIIFDRLFKGFNWIFLFLLLVGNLKVVLEHKYSSFKVLRCRVEHSGLPASPCENLRQTL